MEIHEGHESDGRHINRANKGVHFVKEEHAEIGGHQKVKLIKITKTCTYPEPVAEADRGKRDMRLKEVSEVENLVLLAIFHLPEVHRLLISRYE